jgi:tetratricopeptide (TPR) repeat protein
MRKRLFNRLILSQPGVRTGGYTMGDDSDDEYLWIGRGDELAKQNRYKEAVAAFDRAIRINPENVLPWNLKGNALYTLNRYEEAVAAFDQAIRYDPDHVYAWTRKGDALYDLKRYSDAVAAYDHVLRSDPQNEFAWIMKGMSLADLGRYTEALDCIGQALRIVPDAEPFRKAREYVLNAVPKPELSLDIDRSRFISDKWDWVTVKIKNIGEAGADSIRLSCSDTFETVSEGPPFNLDAGAGTSRDVAIKPKPEGNHVLGITTTYRSEYGIEYTKTHEFRIDVINGT